MQRKSIICHLGRWEEYTLFVVMMFMLAVLGAQVFCRYFLSFSFSWAEQGARIGFVWLTMVGISLAAKHGIHLKVDMLPQAVPKPVGRVILIVAEIFTMCFGLFMGWLIFKTVLLQLRTGQAFSAIPWLPTWTMYMAGVVGMLGLTLRTMQRVFFTKHPTHPTHPPKEGQDTPA